MIYGVQSCARLQWGHFSNEQDMEIEFHNHHCNIQNKSYTNEGPGPCNVGPTIRKKLQIF